MSKDIYIPKVCGEWSVVSYEINTNFVYGHTCPYLDVIFFCYSFDVLQQ